ncbi:hypothetical protein EDB89DRAFT_1999540 [Lactarius sanguifluus]|nr:hypothetical protein EDB89DRAFT_1999540 [Lactarius sanguifluus]
MVSTSSPQPENDTKRQRHTLEKAKVVNLSKQLQIRLQYARLKVEHGWQRQSLNEVENLYFHHSTLKGKSKARSVSTVASPFTPSTTNGPSPKKTSVDSFPEPKQGPPIVPVPSPPPAVVVSPPPTTTHPLVQGTGTPSPPDYSTLAVEGPSSLTPSTTPAPAPASFPPSVLSAFSQNYTVSQRTATMDFSTLSPFVSPLPLRDDPQRLPRRPLVLRRARALPPAADARLSPLAICAAAALARSHSRASFHTPCDHAGIWNVHTALVVPRSRPDTTSTSTSTFPRLRPRSRSHTLAPFATHTSAPHANSRTSTTRVIIIIIILPPVPKNFRHPHRAAPPGRRRWCGDVGHAERDDDDDDAAHVRLRSGARTCPLPQRAVVVSEGGAVGRRLGGMPAHAAPTGTAAGTAGGGTKT